METEKKTIPTNFLCFSRNEVATGTGELVDGKQPGPPDQQGKTFGQKMKLQGQFGSPAMHRDTVGTSRKKDYGVRSLVARRRRIRVKSKKKRRKEEESKRRNRAAFRPDPAT